MRDQGPEWPHAIHQLGKNPGCDKVGNCLREKDGNRLPESVEAIMAKEKCSVSVVSPSVLVPFTNAFGGRIPQNWECPTSGRNQKHRDSNGGDVGFGQDSAQRRSHNFPGASKPSLLS